MYEELGCVMNKKKIMTWIVCIICLLCSLFSSSCKSTDYNKAKDFMNNQQYDPAIELFRDLGSYKDSPELLLECEFKKAEELYLKGYDEFKKEDYNKALEYFTAIDKKALRGNPSSKDIDEYISICNEQIALARVYSNAMSLFNAKKYNDSIALFESLGNYKDSVLKANTAKYNLAIEKYSSNDYEGSLILFNEIKLSFASYTSIFPDLDEYVENCMVNIGVAAYNDREYSKAIDILKPMIEANPTASNYYKECLCAESLLSVNASLESGDYAVAFEAYKNAIKPNNEFASAYIIDLNNSILNRLYTIAVDTFKDELYYSAYNYFSVLGDYNDSEQYLDQCPQELIISPSQDPAIEIATGKDEAIIYFTKTASYSSLQKYIAICDLDGNLVYAVGLPSMSSGMVSPTQTYCIVKAGKYIFIECSGETWWGEKQRFGPDGYYCKWFDSENNTNVFVIERRYAYTITFGTDDGGINNDEIGYTDF